MRDPENPRESRPQPLTGPAPLKMASDEYNLRFYLEQSAMVRRGHGVERLNGQWRIVDPQVVNSLPGWQQAVIAQLTSKKSPN